MSATGRPAASTQRILASGLRAVHVPKPGPLASIYLWFDVGTVDEASHEAGAAHLLEHMVFKGTRDHGVGEAAAAIEGLGGDLNAYTVWDQTVLHATVLAEHWREALDVLEAMAWHPLLDPDELEREKDVVIEEIRGYANDPGSVIEDQLTEALFPDHPYGRPVLGTETSVADMAHADLVAFHRRNYGSDRCTAVVAGPMAPEAVFAACDALEAFASTERAPVPALVPASHGVHRVDGDFETPMVLVGFRCPGLEGEAPAMEVLAQALGGGRASLLQRELRFRRGLVNDVWCSTYARRTGGSFEIGLIPAEGRRDEALQALFELLDDARRGLDAEDVARAKTNLLADRAFASESVDSLAHDAAWFACRTGDPEGREVWDARVAATDTIQLTHLADQVMRDPTMLVLDPGAELPALPSVERARPTPMGVWRSGIDDDWADQGPILSVYVGFPGGRLAEPPDRAGLAEAWASTVTQGAGPYDSVELAAELDRIAGSIRAVSGQNSLGLQLKVPSVHTRRGLELLKWVVEAPRFSREDWERNANELRFELDTLPDRPDDVLSRRLGQLAFPDHPWGRNLTRTSLRRLHPRVLRAFHETHLAAGIRVGIAGQAEPSWLTGLSLEPHALRFPLPELAPPTTGKFTSRAGNEQAYVVLARRAPPIGHPDQPALAVAAGLLGSQSGRLFLELRERRSLAYSVWANKREGMQTGLFHLGLATDPSRKAEASRTLREVFEQLNAEGPTDEELHRTVTMLLGQFATAQQSAGARSAHLALSQLYGHPPHFAYYRDRLLSVDRQAVIDALQRLEGDLEVVVLP